MKKLLKFTNFILTKITSKIKTKTVARDQNHISLRVAKAIPVIKLFFVNHHNDETKFSNPLCKQVAVYYKKSLIKNTLVTLYNTIKQFPSSSPFKYFVDLLTSL